MSTDNTNASGTAKQTRDSDAAAPSVPPHQQPERNESVNSAAFFEAEDEYDDFDDFAAGGGGGGLTAKMGKRQGNRGGGGSGTIYSSKHIRAKATQTNKK